MKYAHEVIDLLAAHPGRAFKMRQVLNVVSPRATPRQRLSIREGVRRVLLSLEESGQVESTRGQVPSGADVEYWWKPQHEVLANRNANRNNIARDTAS